MTPGASNTGVGLIMLADGAITPADPSLRKAAGRPPTLNAGVGEDVVGDFDAVVQECPRRTAVVHNGVPATYAQFAARVRLTASRYRATGFGSGARGSADLVGALVSHTPDAAEQVLAILRAGAAYCPIDANLPATRMQAIASVLGIDRLHTLTADPARSTGLPNEVLGGIPVAPDHALPQTISPDNPAYVLCTSGSTGAPKPVVVSRQALTATVRALRRLFALTPDDRVLQFASLGWDTCLEEILPALTAGATLVFDDGVHCGSMPRFARTLAAQEITVVDLPTAFWHELVLFLHEERATLPPGLRLVVIGGERVDPTRLRQWRDLDVGHIRLLNTYGCTETTMITHAVQLAGPGTERAVATHDGDAPLGRALPHVRDHITADGELLISGTSLASCYLRLLEYTDSAFPIADHGGGPTRWFRTGDLVTRDQYGLLRSTGRVDEQVKVLGVRVHPAEVETQLNAHQAVAGSVVVGEHSRGRTTLTAYVVPAGDTTAAALKSFLRERLPSQFVPAIVKFVATLEYTASGKIDRSATQRAARQGESKGTGP